MATLSFCRTQGIVPQRKMHGDWSTEYPAMTVAPCTMRKRKMTWKVHAGIVTKEVQRNALAEHVEKTSHTVASNSTVLDTRKNWHSQLFVRILVHTKNASYSNVDQSTWTLHSRFEKRPKKARTTKRTGQSNAHCFVPFFRVSLRFVFVLFVL